MLQQLLVTLLLQLAAASVCRGRSDSCSSGAGGQPSDGAAAMPFEACAFEVHGRVSVGTGLSSGWLCSAEPV
jgi:hypothetical protein